MIHRIVERYQNSSLSRKITTVFLCGILIYVILFLTYGQVLYQFSLKQDYLKNCDRVASEFQDGLQSEMSIINNMSISIMKNTQVREYLNEENPSLYLSNQVREEMYQFVNLEDYVESIYLIHRNDSMISINYVNIDAKRKNQFDEVWKESMKAKKGKASLALNAAGGFQDESYDVLSHMRAVYDLDSQEFIGYLVINISMKFFEEKIVQSWNDSDTFLGIVDSRDQIEISRGEEKTFEKCVKERKKIEEEDEWSQIVNDCVVIRKPVLDSGLFVVYINRIHLWKLVSSQFLVFSLVLILITGLFLMILKKIISATVTQPIAVLAQYMEKTRDGYLYRVNMKTHDDEIGLLKDTYNRMLVQTNTLITRLVEEETQKQQLELDVLQEQINPHFLYNTLATIEYMVLTEEKEKAYHALQTLADFYRNFLSGGSKVITLKQEMAIARDYMELQQMRFDHRTELVIQMDPELEKVKIVRLILQPLIENSLVHGIYPKGEDGLISITAEKISEEKMKLEIYDNGIGMDMDQIHQILESDTEEKKHFGLKGTLQRVGYFYHISDFYTIESEEGQNTKITFYLPVMTEGEI